MSSYRTHPAPCKPDFHCALLWLRALEIENGLSPALCDIEVDDLFSRYRPPWRA